MRGRAVLWLAARETAAPVALLLALAGFVVLPAGNLAVHSVWMAVPALMGVAAFFIPPAPWLRTLPIRRSDIILARLTPILAIIWLPLATGAITVVYRSMDWGVVRRPLMFGALLTGTLLLAWLALSGSSRSLRRAAALAGALCGVAALWLLPATGAIVAVALGSVWLWANLPLARFERQASANSGWFWPLVKANVTKVLLAQILLAACAGWQLSWTYLFLVGWTLLMGDSHRAWLSSLPLSRRALLWAMLAPLLGSLLLGIFVGFNQRSVAAVSAAGDNLPPLPNDSYVDVRGMIAPPIRSPWGETVQPPEIPVLKSSGVRALAYDPYFVGPGNSERFAAWQFARKAQDVYGIELSKDSLRIVLRGRFEPLAEQPRMRILTAALATALLLFFALLGFVCKGPRENFALSWLQTVPWWAGLLPTAIFFSGAGPGGGTQKWLLFQVSPSLPHNNFLMAAILIAALAPLYWLLEIVFRQIEFPDKKAQTNP